MDVAFRSDFIGFEGETFLFAFKAGTLLVDLAEPEVVLDFLDADALLLDSLVDSLLDNVYLNII
jgi:hypothetical protein